MNETKTLKKVRIYSPDVVLIKCGGIDAVEKTYRNRILPVRLFGICLIAWEAYIYSKLNGVSGIPRLIAKPDPVSIIITYIKGENLRETKEIPDRQYFTRLAGIIEQMHKRGVIHLDLRNRRNYVIDDEGLPYILDFGSCLYIPWPGFLRDVLAKIDWMGFLKIKCKLAPGFVTRQEEYSLNMGIGLSRLWIIGKAPKFLRNIIRNLIEMFSAQ
ncbi:MAG: hypothetical protein U9P49_07645 [Thermodesulfobacteriota bacterium]|nr:hypothetical protein [Thermodesulfobacteriota bacterium]